MEKSKFTETKIFTIVLQDESGSMNGNICREHGISQQTLCNWHKKYAGIKYYQLLRLKEFESELVITLSKNHRGFYIIGRKIPSRIRKVSVTVGSFKVS